MSLSDNRMPTFYIAQVPFFTQFPAVMSPRKPAILLISAAATSLAFGAEAIYTEPVGFVKLGNPSANQTTPAVTANTDVRISVPLERPLEFSGTAAAVTSTTIQVSGSPNWAADKWTPASGQPYSAIISSGTQNGLRALITSHTSNTLTLQVVSTGNLSQVAINDKVEIRACWTIGSLFANSDISNDCQLFVYEPSNPSINQGSAYKYIYFEGTWYLNDGVTFPVSNNVVLYPGESFILRSGPTSINGLVAFGDVHTSNLRNEITRDGAGADDNHIASMAAIPVKLGEAGIAANDDDQIFLYDNPAQGINKGTLMKLIHFGGDWYVNQDPYPLANDLLLKPGSGFIYRKSAIGPAQISWTMPAP